MAWKLQKDKLQSDPAKEETGEAAVSKEGPDAFSFSDTATKEPAFAPDAPEATFYSFQEDPAGEAVPHGTPEEPHFSGAGPTFAEPAAVGPTSAEEPAALSPFVPYQPEETASPSFLGRDETAATLVSPGDGDDVPRVAPFIVDVPPVAEEPVKAGTLVIRIGNLSANYTLTKEATTIGRPDSAAQSYPDIEIELDDAVSRRHAEIRHRNGEYFLVDMMSTNGTLLNGQRIADDEEQLLLHGDRIRIGDRTEIVFE